MPDAEAVRMSNVKSGAQFTQPPRTRRPQASRCYQEQAARFGLSGQHRSMECSLCTIRRYLQVVEPTASRQRLHYLRCPGMGTASLRAARPQKVERPHQISAAQFSAMSWTLALTATGRVDSNRHLRLFNIFCSDKDCFGSLYSAHLPTRRSGVRVACLRYRSALLGPKQDAMAS